MYGTGLVLSCIYIKKKIYKNKIEKNPYSIFHFPVLSIPKGDREIECKRYKKRGRPHKHRGNAFAPGTCTKNTRVPKGTKCRLSVRKHDALSSAYSNTLNEYSMEGVRPG
jgi:hypothetical protein